MEPHIFSSLVEKGFNRIPITRQILADLDTPVSAYLKLGQGPYSYLFESVEGGENWGRYSIIGLPASTIIKIIGKVIQLEQNGKVQEQLTCNDPLAWIEEFLGRFKVPQVDGLPRFTGGLVGYFGYDTIRYIEPRLAESQNPDPLACPDILLMVSDEVLVFDNLSGRLHFIVHVDPHEACALEKGQQRISELIERLANTQPKQPIHTTRAVKESDFISSVTQAEFEQSVQCIKDYILEGDVMQVVLSQRMSIPFLAPPIDLYRALRCTNPSPYMYYLDLAEFNIVGSSPEILVRVEDETVTVRPIAGTRRRGRDHKEDLELEIELLNDPKELAEHLMLIDLGRNDVGRVAKVGTVQVTQKMTIERYSQVMHIVSNVIGQVTHSSRLMDVLRATFPAGTVSGAPKIRAMEILDELEPVKRGVYAGAVGYLSWHNTMDTAIAIRTAVIKNQHLYIQAGAGVVADSVPHLEWEETMNKGRAIFKAVVMAEAGLDGGQKCY